MRPEILILIPCVFVLVGCICRVDQMRWDGSRSGWLFFYVGMAFVAASVMADTLMLQPQNPHDWATVLTLVLYLFMTRRQWKCGPPQFTNKQT